MITGWASIFRCLLLNLICIDPLQYSEKNNKFSETEISCWNRSNKFSWIYIEFVTAKVYSMLGFIKRIRYKFRDVRALKSIYYAHVRSHLEYGSIVWQPHCTNRMNELESIQKKFLMYAPRKTVFRDENFRLPPYESRCKELQIDSLQKKTNQPERLFCFRFTQKPHRYIWAEIAYRDQRTSETTPWASFPDRQSSSNEL